jgi:hypothetical protein
MHTDPESLDFVPPASGLARPEGPGRWPRKGFGRDPDLVISTYLAAWNAADEAVRRRYLQASWSDGGRFEDPFVQLLGRPAMSDYIGACRAAVQGDARWTVRGAVEHHHGRMLFAWRALDGSRRDSARGHCFASLDADGRIRRLIGFVARG